MKRLVLGVTGHVDHGKTALVRALTGQDTDRLPEEKQRGISIALGFAHLRLGRVDIDLVDMPGHERFVRTMIAGASGIDAVLLVVAANEGVKPQTVEHVEVARLLGLRHAVLAISKTDLVDAPAAHAVAQDAMRLLARAGLAAPTPVFTSTVANLGVDDLRLALASLAQRHVERSEDGIAFLPIDRAFSISGHGPVVTGTLRGGCIAAGDTLELLPARRKVRVRGVQVHGAPAPRGRPGQRVALNLRDVEASDLKRGMAVATVDALAPTPWLTLAIRAVDSAAPLRNGLKLQGLVGTQEFAARLRLLDRDMLEPGHSGFAQLHCATPVATPARECVVLRLPSPVGVVAGGEILDTAPARLRRNCRPVLERLETLCSLPPPQVVAAEIQRAGAGGTSLRRLSQLSALSQGAILQLLEPLDVVVTRSGVVVQEGAVEQLAEGIPARLAQHPSGLAHDKLLSVLPGTATAVLDLALSRLIARGLIVKRGGQLMLPRPEEDAARAEDEAALAAQIAATLQEAGLTPPDPKAIVTDLSTKRAVDRLLKQGAIVRAVDRAKGREILFHRDAVCEAQERLSPLLGEVGGLLVSEIGEALGISRKYSMPLLDHLDELGFTCRVGDRRVRGPAPQS